jgi:hypothetical protein
MSTDLDRRLRAALHDVADVPAPEFAPAAALTGARRRRRRRATALVAGVAAVAAAAIAVPAVALRPGPAQPAAAAGRSVVAGYAFAHPRIVTRSNLGDYRMYDRRSGRYVATPWRTAVPSPDGRLVAVSAWEIGKVGIVAADRVLDPTAVKWIANSLGGGGDPSISAVWSPDGSRVLLDAYFASTLVENGPGERYRVEFGALLVDARTMASRVVLLRSVQTDSPAGMGKIVFGPGGKNFAVAMDVGEVSAPSDGVLVLFDERGSATAQIRIGPATVPDQPFSPDGRLVAVHSSDVFYGGSTRVLTLATGAEVGRSDGDVVGWLDDRHYVVRAGGSVRVVELGSGRVLAEKRLAPTGGDLTGVWPVALRGTAPPGAIVL